jgi:hypothetical protein
MIKKQHKHIENNLFFMRLLSFIKLLHPKKVDRLYSIIFVHFFFFLIFQLKSFVIKSEGLILFAITKKECGITSAAMPVPLKILTLTNQCRLAISTILSDFC